MPRTNTTRQIRNINGVIILAELARKHGMSLRRFLAGTRLQKADLENPTTTVAFEDEFRLIRNLLEHTGDPAGLGLEAGHYYRFTSLASVGFALVSSPNLRSAFDITLRYAELNPSLIPVVLDRVDEDLPIGFAEHEIPQDLRRFAIERTSSAAICIARDLLGREITPKAWQFSFTRPQQTQVYQHFAGITPIFSADKSLLVFKGNDADTPFLYGNPLAHKMAEEACRQMLTAWRKRSGLTALVREKLLQQPGRIADMATVADTLHMSVRTLRRRLHEEGTHYLGLCDEARQALAEELLSIPRLPIDQIAERLGYAEGSSFSHAFKRWTGLTPQAWRRQCR